MAGRVQCRYGQGKMHIHVLLGGVDPENFPGGGGSITTIRRILFVGSKAYFW